MQLTLKRARRQQGLTLSQLAQKSGVNKSTVSRIERGAVRPMHETAMALEAALGLKRGTLVFEQHEACAS